MKPYYEQDGITIYHGDCREILPEIPKVDLVLTDPPYLTSNKSTPILGRGVGRRLKESNSVGMPWGYSCEWISSIEPPDHWIVFCNHKMLGDVCSQLPPSSVFVWRKPNAPQMTRPVPRFDCEFIVWSRGKKATCGDMGQFKSLVIDVAMPQAGCMATERILKPGTGEAAHPCQKPIAIINPFIERLPCRTILDPYMGTGTTLVAAKQLHRKAIGIELEERYCEIAVNRLAQGVLPFTEGR